MMDRPCLRHVGCTADMGCELCQTLVRLVHSLPEVLDFWEQLLSNIDSPRHMCKFWANTFLCVAESIVNVAITVQRCLKEGKVLGKGAKIIFHTKKSGPHAC